MRALFSLICFYLFFQPVAFAEQSMWVSDAHLRARFLSVGMHDNQKHQAALQIELEEGWHTYWHEPGDAGLPPRFDWNGSKNIERITLHWPAPVQKLEHGFQTNAYEDAVIFPLDITLRGPSKSAVLNLNLEIMVCKDICIPQKLTLAKALGADDDMQHVDLIGQALKKIPEAGDHTVFEIVNEVHAE